MARCCLALAACLAAGAEGARLQPVEAEDRSALYQQGIQVRRVRRQDPAARAFVTSPEMVARLQAISGNAFTDEDLQAAPITDAPFRHLEELGQAYSILNGSIAVWGYPVQQILDRATGRKANLRYRVKTQTLTLQSFEDMFIGVAREWRDIAVELKNRIPPESYGAFPGPLQEMLVRINTLMASFSEKVDWLVSTTERRAPHWGEMGKDMVGNQMEVMKAIVSEFSEEKDQMLQKVREVSEELVGLLIIQAKEPFTLIGNGTCLDPQGREYSTFESPGCETLFSCISGCRMFSAGECRGVTLSTEPGEMCGRCELRMESGVASQKAGWVPVWNEGGGQGEMQSAGATLREGMSCYKRAVPEWHSWPSNVKKFIEQDIERLTGNLVALSGSFKAELFKVDRYFWEVESSYDLVWPALMSGSSWKP